MTGPISWGGILAAGDGSRLVRDGYRVPKPLVPVAGVPLVEHAIENVLAAGVERVIVLFNEREQDCADFVRARFPGEGVEVILKTTSSSLESFLEISARLPAGRALFSTVDAWCPRRDFVRFARAAEKRDGRETVLAVTRFVDDERPLWVRADASGRVTTIGGDAGDMATAGAYVFSQRAREVSKERPHARLRNFLGWLLDAGEPVGAVAIEKVIDVDRASDVAAAEAFASSSRGATGGGVAPMIRVDPARVPRSAPDGPPAAWGIYRELAHSPGRETDDALILTSVAQILGRDGFPVELKTAEEVVEAARRGATDPPPCLFVMCERPEILETLARWEAKGVCQVNATSGISNTYRDRTLALFARAGIPFPKSRLVETGAAAPRAPGGSCDLSGCWIKRGDVHNTQAGDVLRAVSTEEALSALSALSLRGVPLAVIQEHAAGDLVKFYGVGAEPDSVTPPWFEWFYHRDQELARHPFDARALAAVAARAARALGLEVYGGDAIVAADGTFVVIDLNAWPSFALYRDEAAARIAAHLASRFQKHVRTGVAE